MEALVWTLTGMWLAGFGVLWWRAFRHHTARRMAALVVGGLVGLVPYSWLLHNGGLTDGYRAATNLAFILIALVALVAAAGRAQSRRTTR